jgi:hypothetical protein
MCDEQARKKFHEDNPHPGQFEYYTSHYDPKTNICYIGVHRTTADKNSVSKSTFIYDAFEGRGYASYNWININSQGKKYWEVKPMQCFVQPIGKDRISCSSDEEFNTLAETHFGIAE